MDYTFAAVGIGSPDVDLSGNCGNMSAAIGPFAYNHGLAPRANQPNVTIRIHNTNTNKIIHSTFPVTHDGKEAATSGDCAIAGVPGTGAEIKLVFLDPAGSKTGALLPTGNAVDTFSGVEASCVDAANPCVFVRAADVGLGGAELPDDILRKSSLLHRLEEIRRAGAQVMGLCADMKMASRSVPKIAIVSKPTEHKILSGEKLGTDKVDLIARVMADRQPHRAIPLTATVCAGIAASVQGSIVESLLRSKRVEGSMLTLGHPSGAIQVGIEKDRAGNLMAATVLRTARSLMEGKVYY